MCAILLMPSMDVGSLLGETDSDIEAKDMMTG